MRVMLMRHAPTEPSAERFVRGWSEVGLCAAGRRTAARAGTALRTRGLIPSVIIASDKSRSFETAHIANRAGGFDAPIEMSAAFRDRGLGEWEGRLRCEFDDALAANGGYDWTPRGAESLDVFKARLDRAWSGIVKRPEPVILIVTHLGCLYWLLMRFAVISDSADVATCEGFRPCGIAVFDVARGHDARLVELFAAGALSPQKNTLGSPLAPRRLD